MTGNLHSQIEIPNYSRPSTLFPIQFRLFQFSEIQGLFKAGLEFKAGAGTLCLTALSA